MQETRSALAEHGIRLRDDKAGSHKTVCPNCSSSRRKKSDPCLSVTIETDGRAVWNCHHCGWAGATGGEGYRPARERRTYRRPERVAGPHRPDTVIAWFAKRGISQATVEKFGIYKTRQWFPQTEREEDCIAFPYEWDGALRNVKYRTADKQFRQEKDPEPVFFNADSIADGKDLIICEGEIDVMAMAEAGFEHVISLPNGAPSGPETSDKRYEPFGTHWDAVMKVKRVLIATDMDEPGETLAQEIARRVGRDRCYRVRMPNQGDAQCKDADECLVEHGADVLRECVVQAEAWPIDGLHDVETFALDVMDLYHGRGPQPVTTGFAELDRAFKYIPGQFIAVTGIPNHGKSRVVDQIAVQTARLRGEKWAMFSPETGEANHVADLCEIWMGMPFFDGPNMRMTEADVSTAMVWLNQHIFMLGAVEHTPSIDWLLERARAAVIRYGVTNIVIDPYNELDPDSELTLYDRHIIDREIYTGDEAAKRANVCTLKYFSPERQYEIADVPLHERDADTGDYLGAAWARVEDEIAIYGEHEDPITLTFCTDASQAQRIARRLFHMRRADKMVLRTTFAGLAAWRRNTITVEIPDVGDDGESIFVKCRKAAPVRVNDGEGTCEIALTVIPDILKTAYSPETDEAAAPPVLKVSRYETPFDEPTKPAIATVVEYPDGYQEVRTTFAAATGAVTARAQASFMTLVEVVNGQTGAISYVEQWGAWFDLDVLDLILGYDKGDTPAETFAGKKAQFRCGFFNEDGEFSGWSGALSVSSLAIDNAKPSAPLLSVTGSNANWAVEATIPNQPRIAWARVEKNVAGAGWVTHSTHDVRPGETIETTVTDTVSSGETIEIRAFCFTSNNTSSDASNVFSHTEA